MVQGGDWLKSGDRTLVIQYLTTNNIKLVQFPYTRGISSSEIKEKAYYDLKEVKKEKSLDFDFYKRLKLLPIKNLLTYEDFDPKRVKKITESITSTKTFFNPITVGDIGEKSKYLVVDGANRLEALKKLKAKYVFVQIIDYLNPDEVELRGNEHYLNCSFLSFKNLLCKSGVLLEAVEESNTSLVYKNNENLIAILFINDKEYFLNHEGSFDLEKRIDQLNNFVKSYKNNHDIFRKSEVGDVSQNYPIVIKFKKFTTSEIIEVIYKNLRLESGITWHIIDNSIIHFKIPISILLKGFNGKKEAESALRKLIKEKIENLSIRRYVSNIYICDEWEKNNERS
jgi:hypothetical protein